MISNVCLGTEKEEGPGQIGACPLLSWSSHLHPFYTLCEGDMMTTLVLGLREPRPGEATQPGAEPTVRLGAKWA